jgi:hypothetical protein
MLKNGADALLGPTKLLDLGFEVLGPMHGSGVLSLPISGLWSQLEIFTPHAGDFLTQLGNFALKLPNQLGQTGRLGRRMWFEKRVFHDEDAANPIPTSMKRSTSRPKQFRRSFTCQDISTLNQIRS